MRIFNYSIEELHLMLQERRISANELLKETIGITQKYNPVYKPFVQLDFNTYSESANELDEKIKTGESIPRMAGLPVGVKDIFNTVDFPTQMGSEIWKGFTPGNDARVVSYLRNAGMSVIGKTVTAEFAVHALNETLNPYDVARTPGTSSSGSVVAVALGMVPIALASQTAGSIIRPGSFCGVYGFKPSFGLIPRTGALKTTDSLDSVGYFVSNVNNLRPVLDCIRVRGPNYPMSYQAFKDENRLSAPKNRPWKVAILKGKTWDLASEECKLQFDKFVNSLEKQGVIPELVDIDFLNDAHAIHENIYNKSLSYYFEAESKNVEVISSVMSEMIRKGKSITAADYVESLQRQSSHIIKVDRMLSDYDVGISLSTGSVAPLRNEVEVDDPSLIWTLTHLPALNVPLFKSTENLPFGLQVVSRKYNDYKLLSFVEQFASRGTFPTGCVMDHYD